MTALKSITPTCGKGYVRLKKIEEGVVYYRYTKLRCKRWDCPECRAVKAKAVQAAIYRVMDKKKLWFATITDLHNTSLETAWATFGSRWNHLRTLLVREFGPMTYIRVMEPHKEPPYPHMHVIMNLNVPQKRLKQLCLRAGFGYICDIRPVTSDHAAWYVSKYLTKEWMSRQANLIRQYTRCRIVQASRDIGAIFAKVSNWEAEEIFPRKMDMLHDSKMLALDIVNRTRDQCEMDWGSFGFEIKYRPEQIVERELWISPEGVFPNAMWGAEIARAQHTIVEASMPWILHEAVIDDTEDLLFGYGNHHSPPPLKPPLHSGYGVATGPNGSHLGNAWDPDFVPELVLT